MGNEKDLLKKFGLHGDPMLKKRAADNANEVNHMASPSYLRQSSALINEALKTGFDVLQLSNGDIVTTGTRTIVNKYVWDSSKGKLIKSKPGVKKGEKGRTQEKTREEA